MSIIRGFCVCYPTVTSLPRTRRWDDFTLQANAGMREVFFKICFYFCCFLTLDISLALVSDDRTKRESVIPAGESNVVWQQGFQEKSAVCSAVKTKHMKNPIMHKLRATRRTQECVDQSREQDWKIVLIQRLDECLIWARILFIPLF